MGQGSKASWKPPPALIGSLLAQPGSESSSPVTWDKFLNSFEFQGLMWFHLQSKLCVLCRAIWQILYGLH